MYFFHSVLLLTTQADLTVSSFHRETVTAEDPQNCVRADSFPLWSQFYSLKTECHASGKFFLKSLWFYRIERSLLFVPLLFVADPSVLPCLLIIVIQIKLGNPCISLLHVNSDTLSL